MAGNGESMTRAEAMAIRVGAHTSRTFRCVGCNMICSWCVGCADEMPEHCDSCWMNVNRAQRAIADALFGWIP